MSLTLSVFFEPSAKMRDAKDLVNAINAKISGMAEYDEEVGSCDINCYCHVTLFIPASTAISLTLRCLSRHIGMMC